MDEEKDIGKENKGEANKENKVNIENQNENKERRMESKEETTPSIFDESFIKEQEKKAEKPERKGEVKPEKITEEKPKEEEKEVIEGPKIFAVKTSIGHEKIVAESIRNKAEKRKAEVYSILCPATIRGYVFVESNNYDALSELVKGLPKVRGVVKGETKIEEIEHFLTPKPLVSGIQEGDIVELVAGPFKGEKARVHQIDEAREEITVELIEAMVAIPITVRGDHVRVVEKEKKK
ncbi:MAG: transcription elongation factor Spt5 [Thermoplasmata archaeon]